MKNKKNKITILTKSIDTSEIEPEYPDVIQINTVVEDNEHKINFYYLMTETGEEIKGDFSHIIKLQRLLGGTIVKDSDYLNYVKPKTDKQHDIYKVYQEHFYSYSN